MSIFFVLLLFASLVSLAIGLINPNIFQKLIKNPTRKSVSLVFALVFIGSIIGIGFTAPEPDPNPVDDALKQEQVDKKAENQTNGERNSQLETQELKEVPAPTKPQDLRQVTIARVIDGDTVITTEGERIRYIGIDTPETVHPYKSVEFYGKEASNQNKELVSGKTVELEKDISDTDRYGRTLAYLWLGDQMVNATLVREGFAYAYTYPPDVKYSDYFVYLQQLARSNKAGLWINEPDEIKTEPTTTPNTQSSSSSIQTQPKTINNPVVTIPDTPNTETTACLIKGNISYKTGEKIYHIPGGAYYNKTVIDTSYGERWFCTEAEAIAAGWRKSSR